MRRMLGEDAVPLDANVEYVPSWAGQRKWLRMGRRGKDARVPLGTRVVLHNLYCKSDWPDHTKLPRQERDGLEASSDRRGRGAGEGVEG